MLELLKVQQVAGPLPSDAHAEILRHIEDWPRDPTVVTGLTRARRRQRPAGVGVGDILQGRFSLVALIGEGGMSRVFKAIDLRRVEAAAADPYVAVKVLTEPFNEYFGSIVALQREAHKLQSLTHPNIVRVIDCDRDGQTVFMTMEYLAGESLQKKLRATAPGATMVGTTTAGTTAPGTTAPGTTTAGTTAPGTTTPGSATPRAVTPSAALALIAAVGDALEYAHRNHIVHGDLKPGNIIVSDEGEIKVIDFGMARFIVRPEGVAAADSAGQTPPKAVTLRYASPELAAGRDPEPSDDVYALACVAYEALSGRHPFGRASDRGGRDPQSRPPRPAGMRAHQYQALLNALAYDRKDRTPTIRKFLNELLASRLRVMLERWWWLAVPAAAVLMALIYWRAPPATQLQPRSPGTARPVAGAAGAVIRDCPVCPAMTVLPPGRFTQGGDRRAGEAAAYSQPAHPVVIGYALALASTEVTVDQFRDFLAATHRQVSGCTVYDGHWQYQPGASWQAPGFAQSGAHPVTCVSWDDAVAYAAWLSQKTGHSYRLPSASEWEYAARAGTDAAQPWGADPAAACAAANVADQTAERRFAGWSVYPCTDGYVNTAPVGSFKANAFGLYDLLGNAFEWVQDCWFDDYTGAPADGSARTIPGCQEHELRGGSWFSAPQFVSASYRNRFEHDYRSSSVGFRVAREALK